MDARECVVDAGELHRRRLLEAQPRALGLLRVREARVDGQGQRRVAGLLVKHASLHGSAKQPLAGGVPSVLGGKARKARSLKARPILDQPVSRERELGRIRTLGPGGNAGICLEDGLGGEGAVRAVAVQFVDAGVDLAAHGIASHRERATNASVPRRPRHRVERRGAVQGQPRPARKALGRGDADAHARERAWTAAHEHGVDVAHRKAGISKRSLRRGHKLHVGRRHIWSRTASTVRAWPVSRTRPTAQASMSVDVSTARMIFSAALLMAAFLACDATFLV